MWIQHLPILGKIQPNWTWSGHTYHSHVTQQLTSCRSWYVLRLWYLGWTGKGPGARHMVLLPWFLVLDLKLRLKVRYVEIELRVTVYYTFMEFLCDLIAWLPWTRNVSIKNILEVSGLLNCTNFIEGVKCILGFTKKYFCVDCNDLNNILTEGLG